MDLVYDLSMFFNEHMLFQLRYEELQDVVDFFGVVEGRQTFTGRPHTPEFQPSSYARCLYTLYDAEVYERPWEQTLRLSAWDREAEQRRMLGYLLPFAPNDVLIISDADEIISVEALQEARTLLRQHPGAVVTPALYTHYYALNNRATNHRTYGTRVLLASTLATQFGGDVQRVRKSPLTHVIDPGGWHFSYLGDIPTKLRAFSHTELDRYPYNQEWYIEQQVAAGVDLFERSIDFAVIPVDATFPHIVQRYPNYFAEYLRDPGAVAPEGVEFSAEPWHYRNRSLRS